MYIFLPLFTCCLGYIDNRVLMYEQKLVVGVFNTKKTMVSARSLQLHANSEKRSRYHTEQGFHDLVQSYTRN